MTKFALALAALAAFASTASAMSMPGLSFAAESEIRSIVPNADLSNLTSAQVGALGSVLHGEDSAKGAHIRSILN